MRRSLTVCAAAAVLAVAVAPGAAPAQSRACSGRVSFGRTPTQVVTYRGVTCRTARLVLRQYATGLPEPPWRCAIAHAPFDRRKARRIAVSCGYGTGPSDLRRRSHAFVGTVRAPR